MSHQRIRILLVDDDTERSQEVKSRLEGLDPEFLITHITDPSDTIDEIKKAYHDLVLSKYLMKNLDGITLTRQIREFSNIPITIYTSRGNEAIANQALDAGANDYIPYTKDPFNYTNVSKRIKRLVRKSRVNNLYSKIVNDSKGAYSVSVRGVTVFASHAMAELIGVDSPDELIGVNSFIWISEDDRGRIMEVSRKLRSGEENPSREVFTVIRKDGEKRRVVTYSALIDYQGELASLTYAIDVTERAKIRAALEKSEEEYRTLVEFAPDAIVLFNTEGYVESANPATMKITGIDHDEYVGKHFTELANLPAENMSTFTKWFEQMSKDTDGGPFEYEFKTKKGETRWAQTTVSRVIINDELVGLQAIMRDITERKENETKLQASAEHLEELVEERTKDLLNAERMVTLAKLAAMLGHDLKGPLTTIRNAAGLFHMSPDRHETAVRMIEENADRALLMLDELRNWNLDKIDKKPTDMKQLIQDALGDIYIPYRIKVDKQIEIKKTPKIDSTKIRRVIENLVQNSIDALHHEGNLRLHVIADDSLRIIVEDDGIGIDEKELDRIFDMFNSNKKKGMGLGLAYCKYIVEEHGGDIFVESTLGSGTKVTINLPQS